MLWITHQSAGPGVVHWNGPAYGLSDFKSKCHLSMIYIGLKWDLNQSFLTHSLILHRYILCVRLKQTWKTRIFLSLQVKAKVPDSSMMMIVGIMISPLIIYLSIISLLNCPFAGHWTQKVGSTCQDFLFFYQYLFKQGYI